MRNFSKFLNSFARVQKFLADRPSKNGNFRDRENFRKIFAPRPEKSDSVGLCGSELIPGSRQSINFDTKMCQNLPPSQEKFLKIFQKFSKNA